MRRNPLTDITNQNLPGDQCLKLVCPEKNTTTLSPIEKAVTLNDFTIKIKSLLTLNPIERDDTRISLDDLNIEQSIEELNRIKAQHSKCRSELEALIVDINGPLVENVLAQSLSSAPANQRFIDSVASFTRSIEQASELIQFGESQYVYLKEINDSVRQKLLKEVNCDSIEDLVTRMNENCEAIESLKRPKRVSIQNPFGVFKNFTSQKKNADKIKSLEDQNSFLCDISEQYHSAVNPGRCHISGYQVSSSSDKVLKHIKTSIEESIEALTADLHLGSEAESVSDTLFEDIREAFITDIFLVAKNYATGKCIKGTPEESEAVDILRFMFGRRLSQCYLINDPQLLEDQRIAASRLEALPNEISSLVEVHIHQGESFSSYIPLLVKIGMTPNSIEAAQSLMPIVVEIKNNYVEIGNFDLSILPDSKSYNSYQSDGYIFNNCLNALKEAQGADKLKAINIDCWSIIKSTLLKNNLSTEHNLTKANKVLANAIGISLLDLAQSEKYESKASRIHLGHTLYSFPDPNVAVLAILNAWVETGTSGERPFRFVHEQGCKDWVITKYLESLTEETLMMLDQQGYTGVRDLKNLANTDPQNWGVRSTGTYNESEQYISIPNREYPKTVDAVEQIILQVLKVGSYEEKLLAINAYGNLDAISSDTGRKLTLDYLASENDTKIRQLFLKEMIKRGGAYEGDITLAKELLLYLAEDSNFDGISPIKSAYIFKAFTATTPTEDDIVRLEKLSGIPKDDLTRTLHFIDDCTKINSFNTSFFFVPDSEKEQIHYLKKWVELVKNQEFTNVVKLLLVNKCYLSEGDFEKILTHIEQYPNLLKVVEKTALVMDKYNYKLVLEDIPAIVQIYENIDRFSSEMEAARKEIGDFDYKINIKNEWVIGGKKYLFNPFYIAAQSMEDSIWKSAATAYRKNDDISDNLASGVAELICSNNSIYEIPEKLPGIVKSIVRVVASNEKLSTIFDHKEILSALTSTQTSLNIDSILTHGSWVLESQAQLATNKQFQFIEATKNMASLFSAEPEQLEMLREINYDPAIIFGVIAPILNHYSGEIDLNSIIKALPRSLDIINDRYQLEYFTSFIAERPGQNVQIIGNILNRALPLHNGEGQKLIAILSFANSIEDADFFVRINELVNDSSVNSISDLYDQSLKILLRKLSDRYPENLLEVQDPTELAKFVQVYTTYEKTLKHFDASDQIPIMRVIAVSELLGKSISLRTNDPNFIADFQSNIEEYIPLESERAPALSYLAERLVDSSPQMSWDPAITSYKHVIGEVSTEDRILSIRNVLKTMLDAGHISRALCTIESIGTNKNPAKELAEKWRSAKTQEEKDVIKQEQQKLELWTPLRTVLGNFETKCSAIINEFQLIRDQKLQPYADCIEALGFTFHDSFGRRMFRGEIKLLTQAVDDMIIKTEEDFKYRDSLTDLKTILEEATKLNQKADNYLGNIADQISKSLILLSNRRDLIAKIRESLPGTKDTSKLCEAIAQHDGDLAAYIRDNIVLIPDIVDQIQFIERTLQESEELTPIEDCKNLVSIAKEALGKDSIWTFDREVIFSQMLTAMVGQCLDYRSSKNSIGNSVYNVSLVDTNRSVITARDESGAARLNVISYLAPIVLVDGRNMVGLVLDIPYPSDGSAITKDKTTGLLTYAHTLARAMQIPLVVPNRSMPEDIVKDAASELHVDATAESGHITILPGPSGATYVELISYTCYTSKIKLSSSMTIVWPYNIH